MVCIINYNYYALDGQWCDGHSVFYNMISIASYLIIAALPVFWRISKQDENKLLLYILVAPPKCVLLDNELQ